MSVWHRYTALVKARLSSPSSARYAAPVYSAPPNHSALNELNFTVFDTETSGLLADKHHIVQIASMRIQAQALDLGSAWSALIDTQGAVQPDSRLIHEIRPEEQRYGHPEAHVLREFLHGASNSVLLAYDADFDLAFLRRAWKRHAWGKFDVLCLDLTRLAALVLPNWQGQAQGLDDCLGYCGINPADQHRHDALGDTFLAASLALVLLRKAQQQGWHTLAELQLALRHRDLLHRNARLGC